MGLVPFGGAGVERSLDVVAVGPEHGHVDEVAVLDDPRSYPRTTTRYRQTVVACSGPKARYAVSVFEVSGGLHL